MCVGIPRPNLPDRRAQFEALLDETAYEAAWRFAYRLASAREDAEDLLQEALAHAYCRLDQLRDPGRFRAWLFSILRSKYLRRLEQGRRLRVTPLAGTFNDEGPAATGLGGVEASPELQAALAALPAAWREVLLLHYLDGLSLAEVGQALAIGPRAAKQRLYRARNALRGKLSSGYALGDFSALL
jgi:RNA polymerase sigma-70 factor (ECF subfamily)